MNKLSTQDQRYLDAAEGWLGLGDHLSANEELLGKCIKPAQVDRDLFEKPWLGDE